MKAGFQVSEGSKARYVHVEYQGRFALAPAVTGRPFRVTERGVRCWSCLTVNRRWKSTRNVPCEVPIAKKRRTEYSLSHP